MQLGIVRQGVEESVEEPLVPGAYRELEGIAASLGTKIVLDESLTRVSQLAELQHRPEAWIVNLRVSKMGGLLRSIQAALAAVVKEPELERLGSD